MHNINKQIANIENHALEFKYSNIRLPSTHSIEKLASSIAQNGLIRPVITIPTKNQRWLLIDGYVRCSALKMLGKDTITTEIWDCEESQALLIMLADKQSRTWEAIEESLLIRELTIQGNRTKATQQNIDNNYSITYTI